MNDPSHAESDEFDPVKLWGRCFHAFGWLLIAAGFLTMVVGFKLDGHEYSGLMAGLPFALSGVTMLGIGFVLTTAARIGELMVASRKMG